MRTPVKDYTTEFDKQKTVTELIQKASNDICNHYCKWPEQWNAEEHGGMELVESGICDECPLNILI